MEYQKINWNNWNWNAKSFKFHLKGCKTTNYDISKASCLRHQRSKKGQNVLKSCSFRPQKTCITPRFDVFPYTLCTYQSFFISVL